MSTYKVTQVLQSKNAGNEPTPVVYYTGADKVEAMVAMMQAAQGPDEFAANFVRLVGVNMEMIEEEAIENGVHY